MATITYLPAAAGGTVTTSGSISGDGSVGSPILSTKLNAILNMARGADIPDADTTVNPGTDMASEYHVLGPLTANRVLTLGTGGTPLTAQAVTIVNYDTSAFTLTVKNDLVTTLFTFGASPGAGVIRWHQSYFSGVHFLSNISGYDRTT